VVTAGCDIKYGKEVCRLTRGGQHSGRAALKSSDACGNGVAGGILETGVEVARCLKVKELAHILAGGIFEGGGLDDGNLSRLTVTGSITALHTLGFNSKILFHIFTSLELYQYKILAHQY
jgi:hypothetical protein